MEIIFPPPVGIGLTGLPNIGGASGTPGPPGSGITEWLSSAQYIANLLLNIACYFYLKKNMKMTIKINKVLNLSISIVELCLNHKRIFLESDYIFRFLVTYSNQYVGSK